MGMDPFLNVTSVLFAVFLLSMSLKLSCTLLALNFVDLTLAISGISLYTSNK